MFSVNLYLDCGVGKFLHQGSSGRGQGHGVDPLDPPRQASEQGDRDTGPRRVLVNLALLQVIRDGLLRRSDDRRSSKRPKASERPAKPAQRLSAPSRPLWLETALFPATIPERGGRFGTCGRVGPGSGGHRRRIASPHDSRPVEIIEDAGTLHRTPGGRPGRSGQILPGTEISIA